MNRYKDKVERQKGRLKNRKIEAQRQKGGEIR